MFRKTAIALGLAMVAGTGFAAQTGTSTSASTATSVNAGGIEVGANADTSLASQFSALDKNGDGAISRSEASANPRLMKMYDSLDTSNTIEAKADQSAHAAGITRDQFEAGMQAAASGSGVVGAPVSRGKPHIVHKVGGAVSGAASDMGDRGRDAMSGMRNKSESMGETAQQRGASMGTRAQHKSDAMRNRAQRDTSEAYQKATQMGADAKSNAAARTRQLNQTTQDRLNGAGNTEVGGHMDTSTSADVNNGDR